MDQAQQQQMMDLIQARLGEAVPFVRQAMVQLLEVGPGRAVARIGEEPQLKNHLGTQHAGALFTLAETASGAALAGAFAASILDIRPAVRGAQIRYLKAARTGVTATGLIAVPIADLNEQLDREGRVDVEVTVTLVDEAGVEVAAMSVDWVVLKRRAAGG